MGSIHGCEIDSRSRNNYISPVRIEVEDIDPLFIREALQGGKHFLYFGHVQKPLFAARLRQFKDLIDIAARTNTSDQLFFAEVLAYEIGHGIPNLWGYLAI